MITVAISVVIPTLNRHLSVRRCVESVQGQRCPVPFEVIVSLDARDRSSNALFPVGEKNEGQIIVVRARLPGLNAARNRGVAVSRGDIIVFLDDDCVVPSQDWLSAVHEAFRRYPDGCAIGGSVTSRADAPLFARCRNRLSNAYMAGALLSGDRTAALLGGNSAYRRATFAAYGLFDERVQYGATETELNNRICARGGKLYFLAELAVEHRMGRRPWLRYCRQAFLQGRGNGESAVGTGKTSARATVRSWLRVITAERSQSARLFAAFFVLSDAFFYRLGFYWGRLARVPEPARAAGAGGIPALR